MKLSASIEFVYFDLGNILVEFDNSIACANLARMLDVSPQAAHASLFDSGIEVRFELGELSEQEFVAQVRANLGRESSPVSDEAILEAVSDMFTPIDSMRGVLRAVREAGMQVGLLSNTCSAHWNWIVRQSYSVLDFRFDTEIRSYEVGAMKPDQRIYVAAEDAAGVAVDRILFLDDRAANVRAATERGWNAVQCLGGRQAIKALRAHQVLSGIA